MYTLPDTNLHTHRQMCRRTQNQQTHTHTDANTHTQKPMDTHTHTHTNKQTGTSHRCTMGVALCLIPMISGSSMVFSYLTCAILPRLCSCHGFNSCGKHPQMALTQPDAYKLCERLLLGEFILFAKVPQYPNSTADVSH